MDKVTLKSLRRFVKKTKYDVYDLSFEHDQLLDFMDQCELGLMVRDYVEKRAKFESIKAKQIVDQKFIYEILRLEFKKRGIVFS